jgi:hypothetical protein
MKKSLSGAMLIVLFVAIGAHASDPPFLFGVWTYELPQNPATDSMQFCRMLHDTLHFNTIFGQCFTPAYLSAYTTAGLHVISNNETMNGHFLSPEDADTLSYWPRVYGESAYGLWESEGSHLGPCDLTYRGGDTVTINGVNSRYFAATTARVDSVIQTGPSEGCCDYCYGQIPWYYGHLAGGDETYHYEVRWRFKLGPDSDTLHNSDTIAVFYVERTGIPYLADSLLDSQTVVYILDTTRATQFDWSSPVLYDLRKIQSCSEYQCRYVYNMNFKVRWYGKRDIYIDQVKIMNTQGKQLWESPDTLVGFKNLRDFSARWFGDSPTILGWYVMDDQSLRINRDNVYSAYRVDSLLTNWSPHKKAFTVPGADYDYLSRASYSNVSYQSYPIFWYYRTSSEPDDRYSIQAAWDTVHIPNLADMNQLARSRSVKHYVTLQGMEGESNWRRPTLEENLCQVNLALAYGVGGILYWKYNGCDNALTNCCDGLLTGYLESNQRTDTWYEIRDVVGPYMDKMGPIFASLNWQRAWKWGDWPPSGAITWDIQCDQYGQSGQDPLYLQVAEFEPVSLSDDTAYFFLVNRRCLPEESITGTLRFHDFGGIGKQLPIVYHITDMLTGTTWLSDDPHWNSINYTIPPGAGRLYRVTPRCRHHGDANSDGSIDISDVVFLIANIFSGGPSPYPKPAGDANCDNSVDISDVVFLIAYIFSGGSAPCEGCD